MQPAEANSSIPLKLWTYYQRLLVEKPSHPLVEAVNKQGEQRTWQGINDLFKITSQNTGLAPNMLIQCLDFDEKNLDENNLQAAFGVMRTINTLHKLGFVNISPLSSQKSRRESDLLAEHGSVRFAVEVFRSSEAAYRYPNHNEPRHNLQNYITRRYVDKRAQLESTMKMHHCSKALLAVVMDSQPTKSLVSMDELQTVMREAFDLLENPANTHWLIFTGMADINGNDEHALYPPLP